MSGPGNADAARPDPEGMQPVQGRGATPVPVFSELVPEVLRGSVTVIPAELVGLHSLHLPLRNVWQRRAALPFALEDTVGRALDHTHFALCATGRDGRVLAGVADVAMLARHMAERPDRALVPEQLLLRTPDPGPDGKAMWRVHRQGDRVLVRVSDGTGFALQADMLRPVWLASGQPGILNHGASLAAGLVWSDAAGDGAAPADEVLAADLRQGALRPPRNLARPIAWLSGIIAATVVAHLAIGLLDLRAQRAIAAALRADAALALAQHLPEASVDDAPGLLARRLSARDQPQTGSAFLPTLQRVATALALERDALQFRALTWGDAALRLTVDATDLDALQRAEASLRAAGLQVSSGSTTVEAGAARADLTVRP